MLAEFDILKYFIILALKKQLKFYLLTIKTMKKFLLALVVLTGAAFSSFAQTSEDGGKFSIGVEAGLPLGDAGDAYSFAIGGSLKYDLPIAENLFANLSAGYTTLSGKTISGFDVPSLNAIPVKAGLKYFFNEGFYGEAQLGAAFLSTKVLGESHSTTAFAYAPGIGYKFAGGFDAGVRYETWSKDGSTSQLALRLAYSF
jgi:hypothetical protein